MAFLYADEIIAYTTTSRHAAQHLARREIIQCLHAIKGRLAEEAQELEFQQEINAMHADFMELPSFSPHVPVPSDSD